MITKSKNFELVTAPSLALLVFRLNPKHNQSGKSGELGQSGAVDTELDLLNQRLHTRLDGRSDVFLTPTVLKSVERKFYCLRFAMGGVRTTWEDVQETWRVVEEEGERVLAE